MHKRLCVIVCLNIDIDVCCECVYLCNWACLSTFEGVHITLLFSQKCLIFRGFPTRGGVF